MAQTEIVRAVEGAVRSSTSRLVVLANRLPVQRVSNPGGSRWVRSSGGLVTALEPVLRETGGTWVGWPGASGGGLRRFSVDGLTMQPTRLDAHEVDSFYHGMSNRTFWPLYHDAIRPPEFKHEWWTAYGEVNDRFARAAVKSSHPQDHFWVHDYHLQLTPRILRELQPKARIGFFLHIPFPPPELFSWLPWRHNVLRGLLGSDVVGFQTNDHAQNFLRAAQRLTPARRHADGLEFEGRVIRVGAFPISIDVADFREIAARPTTVERAAAIRRRLDPARKVILSVDRLDYTKGLELRLLALEAALKRGDLSVHECVFVQIAVPSRERVPEYAETRRRIEEIVGRINGEFGEVGKVAVHYLRRSLPRAELVAYYLAADVMLVTPLKDGMNLVAKEYVASRPDNSGVLVLSEFAGAARELRRALLVNPHDVDGMSLSLVHAVKIRKSEAARRMATLRKQVESHDVRLWANSFLEALRR